MPPMTLEAARSSLLLIDFQERLMPAIDGAEATVREAQRLAAAARLLDVPVLATEQTPGRLGRPSLPSPSMQPAPSPSRRLMPAPAAASKRHSAPPRRWWSPAGNHTFACCRPRSACSPPGAACSWCRMRCPRARLSTRLPPWRACRQAAPSSSLRRW
ncbi:MAG: isochorismatase family protein [Blastochloris sp.]|nr:isochorismatase family protein [Blastochloris sp.]